jgi:ABC-type multidrug transport system fused ATPase/permease subunit
MRKLVKEAAERGDTTMKTIKFPVDFVMIRCVDLSIGFTDPGHKNTKEAVFTNMSIDLPQGSVICVYGPQGNGKSTFLQLIGQVLVPDEGDVFVPPHLRVLHIPAEVYFIEDELRDNLFFALGSAQIPSGDLQRGLRICKRLGFPEDLMDYIQSTESTVDLMVNNAAVFSRSDRALLNIARAFIYNPEVLVVHNPTLLLDRNLREVCLQALRDFVDERGLEMPPESRHKRRPRTVLFSTNNIDGLKIADQILCCQDQKVRFETFENAETLFSTGESLQRRTSKVLSVKQSVVLQGSSLSDGIESDPMTPIYLAV